MTDVHKARTRMRKKREEAGLSEDAMAELRGVCRGSIRNNEQFRTGPPSDDLLESYSDILSDFVRVSAKYLRTGRY